MSGSSLKTKILPDSKSILRQRFVDHSSRGNGGLFAVIFGTFGTAIMNDIGIIITTYNGGLEARREELRQNLSTFHDIPELGATT
jgi:hypothetical protein